MITANYHAKARTAPDVRYIPPLGVYISHLPNMTAAIAVRALSHSRPAIALSHRSRNALPSAYGCQRCGLSRSGGRLARAEAAWGWAGHMTCWAGLAVCHLLLGVLGLLSCWHGECCWQASAVLCGMVRGVWHGSIADYPRVLGDQWCVLCWV